MKRPAILIALLLLVGLVWLVLVMSDRQRSGWIANARREDLVRYVREHPDQAEALVRLSALRRAGGEGAEAERLARHAVEIAPGDDATWVAFSRSAQDSREAIHDLETYLKSKPESATVMAELARRYLLSGDVGMANEFSERATKVAPEAPDILRVRGEVMAAMRRLPEAEKEFRAALAVRDEIDTRLDLARVLIPLQRYAEIIDLCIPILDSGKYPIVSPEQRARALLYTAGARLYEPLTPDQLSAIQSQLQEADTMSAHLPAEERFLPPYFLGENLLRRHNPREAIPLLKRSAESGPMFPGSLYSLARAYRMAGDIKAAEVAESQHVRLSRILGQMERFGDRLEQKPGDPEATLGLADALAEAGNKSEAARLYQQLGTDSRYAAVARRKLAELEKNK